MAWQPFGNTPHPKKRIILSLIILLLAASLAVFMSCKNEPAGVPVDDGDNTGKSNVDPGTSGEFLLASVEGGDIWLGRIEIWASNLVANPDSGTVSFDAVIVNATERPVYPPIKFVITSLSPPSVTVLNPSGYDEMGKPYFDFSGKLGNDGVLTPFERSEPLRFVFVTGTPSSFVIGYRFDFTWQPFGKMIAGAAFDDLNNDGMRERCEPGIPGIPVTLESRSGDGTVMHMVTWTDEFGQFAFMDLAEGIYSVGAEPPYGMIPTTPNPVLVTLIGDQEKIVGVLFGFYGNQFPGEFTLFGPLSVGPWSDVGPVFDGVFFNPSDSTIVEPPDSGVVKPMQMPMAMYFLKVEYPMILGPFPVRYDSAMVAINGVTVYKYINTGDPTFADPIPGEFAIPDGVIQLGENSIHIEVMGSEYASLIFRVYAIYPVRREGDC